MKFKLSKEDLAKINDVIEENHVARYLKHQDKLKFNVGDILIKKHKSYNYDDDGSQWRVEITSGTNGLPRRYVYVYEDQNGIGFIKRLKVTNGELGSEIICMTDIDLENEKYEVDPLFLDSMLLGDGSFDIKLLQKKEQERKKEIIAFNKAAAFSSNKLSEVNNYLLNNFPVNSIIYHHSNDNFLGTYVDGVKVESIKEKYISRMSEDNRYHLSDEVANNPAICCDVKKYVEIVTTTFWGDKDKITSFDLLENYIYTQKPRSIIGEE